MINQEAIIARWGLVGIFALCLLSATLLPGFSEVGLAALAAGGVYRAWTLVGVASLGNWLGGVITYATGWWLGMEKLVDWFGISAESVAGVEAWVESYGSLCGLLVWTPVIGDPIAAALGLAHSPVVGTCVLMFVGKALRYVCIVFVVDKVAAFVRERQTHTNKIEK